MKFTSCSSFKTCKKRFEARKTNEVLFLYCLRVVLQRLLERSEGFFLDPRHIRPADAAFCGDLPLRQRRPVAQPVAQRDDHPFALRQNLVHDLVEFFIRLPCAQVLEQILVRAQNIHQRQRIPVLPGLNTLRKRNIPRRLLHRPEIHQDLILYTPCCIGCEPGTLAGVEGRDPFDKPDGADRDQILLIGGLRIVFFIRMKQKDTIFP